MNITFVAKKLDMSGGGSNFSLNLMARSLTETGHSISVLTIDPKSNNLPSNPKFEILTPPDSIFGTRFGILEKVYRSLREYADQTDLFHVFTPFFLPAAGLFRKQTNSTPVVGRLNTYSMFCVNMNCMNDDCHKNCNIRSKFVHQDASLAKRIGKIPFYASRTYVEPQLAASLDMYLAISPAIKQIYSDMGIPRNRIEVIPNFYDPKFTEQHESETESFILKSTDELTVLFVGRVEHMKGTDLLLDAIANTEQVRASIVGDGSATEELKQQAERLDITNRVSFEGRVTHSELPSYYRTADIFVHPGRWPEPFGRTLLESFQCGTPAVVSDTGGPPWVVGDAGITFESGNEIELAHILSRLQKEKNVLNTMVENCKEEIERFAPGRILSQIERIYKEQL